MSRDLTMKLCKRTCAKLLLLLLLSTNQNLKHVKAFSPQIGTKRTLVRPRSIQYGGNMNGLMERNMGSHSESQVKHAARRGESRWPFQLGVQNNNGLSLWSSSSSIPSSCYKLSMKKEDTAISSLRSRRSYDPEKNSNHQANHSGGQDYSLSAASLSTSESLTPSFYSNMQENTLLESLSKALPDAGKSLMPVISAALLITSTTVGASMMVLPGLAQGPGMIASSGLILAVYVINLLSGLLIAEVAINQYEASSCEVPSSFKEFADVNLQSDLAGNFVSAVSLFINTCVLSYDLVAAGRLTHQFLTNNAFVTSLGPNVMNVLASNGNIGLILAASFFVALVSTQSGATLSTIASLLCMMLFTCFAGMVLPGIAMIRDPLATFAAKGTSEFGSDVFLQDVSTFVPVLLTAMVYQNIVPTITKMLNYDRGQTVKAIVFGSAIPMIMYVAFCFTVLGGGALPGMGSGNLFLTGITASSVFGSAMACVISIAEEMDVFFESGMAKECDVNTVTGQSMRGTKEASEEIASFPSVALGVLVPTLAGIFFADGDGFVKALSISGSYGSPLLYGVVPVVLAFSQRTAILKELNKEGGIMDNSTKILNKLLQDDTDKDKQLAPGGMFSIGALAVGAITLISTHLMDDLSSLI